MYTPWHTVPPSSASLPFPRQTQVGLYRKCAETMIQTDFYHTPKITTLSRAWKICEVRKALELGYTVVRINEVWKYETNT